MKLFLQLIPLLCACLWTNTVVSIIVITIQCYHAPFVLASCPLSSQGPISNSGPQPTNQAGIQESVIKMFHAKSPICCPLGESILASVCRPSTTTTCPPQEGPPLCVNGRDMSGTVWQSGIVCAWPSKGYQILRNFTRQKSWILDIIVQKLLQRETVSWGRLGPMNIGHCHCYHIMPIKSAERRTGPHCPRRTGKGAQVTMQVENSCSPVLPRFLAFAIPYSLLLIATTFWAFLPLGPRLYHRVCVVLIGHESTRQNLYSFVFYFQRNRKNKT